MNLVPFTSVTDDVRRRTDRGLLPSAITPVIAARLLLVLLALLALAGCGRGPSTVVVYTSQDMVYSEPILRAFAVQTGIRVRALYDSEAVKTVGLVNRLRAERAHPQCDVFWNNEELRTRLLAAAGMFAETNGWAAMGHRSRRLVINTNKLARTQAPGGLLELTNPVWRGKVALAIPLFGTTATHFLALRQHWGDAGWHQWCRGLVANEAYRVDGNSVVVQLVGRGEAWIGLTDSDDIAAGQREGLPLAALPVSEETLLIPNTVAVIRNAPHPQAARALFDYLQSEEVARQLTAAHALESAQTPDTSEGTLRPDWTGLLGDLESATRALEEIFLR